jgi:predicted ATPase
MNRITQLRIAGFRVIEDLTLDLNGLTVLIGDNGTGKSTILEALELLRLASQPISFVKDVIDARHGGLFSVLRRGSESLRLGCRIRSEEGSEFDYDMEIGGSSTAPLVMDEVAKVVGSESATEKYTPFRRSSPARGEVADIAQRELAAFARRLLIDLQKDTKWQQQDSKDSDYMRQLLFPGLGIDEGEKAVTRNPIVDEWINRKTSRLKREDLAVSKSANENSLLGVVNAGLNAIDVHTSFETRPLWQCRELDLRQSPRMPATVEATSRLSRYALNLPNAFQELRNRGGDVWQRVIDRSRLGIRHDIADFRLTARRRGEVELEIVFGGDSGHAMPVEYLSEGQLAYLAMTALCELSGQSSILAFDEPECHFHPGLLARVMMMLEKLSQSVPVLLSTHSERLLDCLPNPATSVVLCDLNEVGALRLRRPDKEALARWLEQYQSIGRVIAEGYTAHLFDESNACL